MTRTLTYKDARHALDGVLRREGKKTLYKTRYEAITGEDYHQWDECLYQSEDGKPLCIVGVALDDLGVEYNPAWEMNGVLDIMPMLGAAGVKLTDKAAAFLMSVQTAQDSGMTWGKAVKIGKRQVSNTDERV